MRAMPGGCADEDQGVVKPRQFTLDQALTNHRAPRPGDVLLTARTVQRVVDARPVESRVWANRWRLTVHSAGTATNHVPDEPVVVPEGCERIVTEVYRRGETPAEFFAKLDEPDDLDRFMAEDASA